MPKDKILIAEISDNEVWYKFFPYYGNTWLVRTNNIYIDLAHPDYELTNIGLINELPVLSFLVDKSAYTKVDTIAEVISNDETFYYNIDDKTLLVHFKNHKPYHYFADNRIEIGFALGFFNSPKTIDGEWNGIQYDPRLISNPSLKSTIDDLFNGKQRLQGGNIKIQNTNLKYKNFNIGSGVKKKNGNFVRTLIWTGDDATTAQYDDFELIYQGVIEKISEGLQLGIDLRDIRSTLTEVSPVNYLDVGFHPDIKDPDKEYLLPELWGTCYRVPCLCLNENANDAGGTADYTFLVCDTSFKDIATDSIITVYINGKETTLTPTVTIDNTQNIAYFSIPAIANFRILDGTGGSTRYENMDKVTIDCEGYLKGDNFIEADGDITTDPTGLLDNAMAIIREILLKNYGYGYSSTFYDIATWQSFEENTDFTYSIGYYLDKQITTQKQIEAISSSLLGTFIWDSNLKFSFDNNDFVSYVLEVPKHKLFPESYFPEFIQDSKNVIAKMRVGLKRKWNERDDELKYEWLIDDSNEDTALVDYNSTQSKDFGTLINNSTDAQKYSTRALEIVGISKDTFNLQTDWLAKDLKAGDWIKVQADFIDTELIGWVKCQVQEVNPNTEKWMVDLTVRIFGYLKELTYNGVNVTKDQKQILIKD